VRRPRNRCDRRLPALVGLAVAVGASATLTLALGSNLTFFREDWELLITRQDWTADSLMRPFLEHIVLAPALIYKLLVATFGIESALPFRVASIAVFSLGVVLLFFWLRRRVGSWPALLGATSIAFLGAAYEDLLWPFQIGYFGSVAAGLGMLLALDREDRRGDAFACGLLAVSLSFSSLGVAFASGALVDLLLGRRPRSRRLFVVLVPLLLFGAWWVGWGRHADSDLTVANFVGAPLYVVEAVAAGLASLLGLAGDNPDAHRLQLSAGLVLALGALGAGMRIRQLGRLPRDVAVGIAIGLTFWTLAALNQTFDRPPTASRYQYPSAVFLLLIAGGLLRGVRLDRRALIAATAVTGVAALSGTALLYRQYERQWLPASESLRASLAGVEIAGDGVRGDYNLYFPPNVALPASEYFRLVRDAGSPAFSESELLASGEPYLSIADSAAAAADEIRLVPSPRPRNPHGCRLLTGAGGLELPDSTLTLVARGNVPAQVILSRFSPTGLVPLGEIVPRASMRLRIPRDLSTRPWRIHLQGKGSVAVCRAGAPTRAS
jgi:hypothetical protein